MNVNGVFVLTARQVSMLTGAPNLQRRVLEAAARYPVALRSR